MTGPAGLQEALALPLAVGDDCNHWPELAAAAAAAPAAAQQDPGAGGLQGFGIGYQRIQMNAAAAGGRGGTARILPAARPARDSDAAAAGKADAAPPPVATTGKMQHIPPCLDVTGSQIRGRSGAAGGAGYSYCDCPDFDTGIVNNIVMYCHVLLLCCSYLLRTNNTCNNTDHNT